MRLKDSTCPRSSNKWMMNPNLDSSEIPAWSVSLEDGQCVWKVSRICWVWMNDFITERIRSWALTQIFSCLYGCLTSSAASLPFHPKWRKIKVCGAYNKITLLFFDNCPLTLAKTLLLIMAFSSSHSKMSMCYRTDVQELTIQYCMLLIF